MITNGDMYTKRVNELVPQHANLKRVAPSIARASAALQEGATLPAERLTSEELAGLLGDQRPTDARRQRNQALAIAILCGYSCLLFAIASIFVNISPAVAVFMMLPIASSLGQARRLRVSKSALLPTHDGPSYRWAFETHERGVEAILLRVQPMGRQWSVNEEVYDTFTSMDDAIAYVAAVDAFLPADETRPIELEAGRQTLALPAATFTRP
jgi:hypothetical protein